MCFFSACDTAPTILENSGINVGESSSDDYSRMLVFSIDANILMTNLKSESQIQQENLASQVSIEFHIVRLMAYLNQ